MSPTNLSAASAALPAAVPSSPAESAQAASADFLLMLGQLIGAAPATAPAASMQLLLNDKDGAVDDEPELAAAPGLLPIALPMAMFDIETAVQQAATADMMPELRLSRGAGHALAIAVDSQALKDLSAALSPASGEPGSTFDSALSPHSLTEAQQPLRTANAESMLSRPVYTPVGSAAWADEIGARLTMMTQQGKQTASLRLSPEHLGPLEIRIVIRDNQASVWFGAAHADTRAAIEQALPGLRELFASQGMSLTDAGVFREAPQQHPTPTPRPLLSANAAASDDLSGAVASRIRWGLVDAYA